MKDIVNQILTISFLLVFAAACSPSSGGSEDKGFTDEETSVKEEAQLPAGLKLMNTSDCNICHRPEEKLVGPSYKEIANKYAKTEETVKQLNESIIKGSDGKWGAAIMPGHANLKEEEVTEMVNYILGLKTE